MVKKVVFVFLLIFACGKEQDNTMSEESKIDHSAFINVDSSVSGIDFSNDLNTAITKGSLSLARSSMSGMVFGNTFGYFGSGGSGATASGYFEGDTTIINRVSFSNDIITTPLRGKMTVQRGRYATSYNSNYGWFAGGRVPGAPNGVIVTSVERIDFSNDLSLASIRGPLTNSSFFGTATTNARSS